MAKSSAAYPWLALPFATLLGSCGEGQDQAVFPYIARIVSSEQGVYALRDVTIETLEDIRTVSGLYGQIRGNAALSVDLDADEVISSAQPEQVYRNRGDQVRIDYIVRKGVIIPQNFPSMEMLGLYYNIERTIQFWSENFSIDFEAIGIPGLFYNPKLSSSTGGVTQEIAAVMNAAYLPGVRDLWFFKTSPHEVVPVKMNFAVVAHEFAHYIFDYRFAAFNPSVYAPPFANHERLLSGLNEGLADYFAYMVTDSPREFGSSLTRLATERSLPVPWTWSTIGQSGCKGSYYCEGSVLASALYEIAQTPGQSALKVGAVVYNTLPDYNKLWVARGEEEVLDYTSFLRLLLSHTPDALLYCTTFHKWFDTENYKEKLPCS